MNLMSDSNSRTETLSHQRTHGSFVHQRKPSLTTVCPPVDIRSTDRREYTLKNDRNRVGIKSVFKLPIIQMVGWSYLFLCFIVSTIHLITSFTLLDSDSVSDIDWDALLEQRELSITHPGLDRLQPELRLSKMFSKSGIKRELIRPYWFTASVKPDKESLTLTTALTLNEWDSLTQLAEIYEGPISATLLVPCTDNINNIISIQQLSEIRNHYETTTALRRYVDIHLILQPGGLTENGTVIAIGGYQESRNVARLFSRTEFIAQIPVSVLWITESMQDSVKKYANLLRNGDVLIVPTFGFPNYEGVATDNWPTDKESIIEWVEEGEMGLLDYGYELNNGPTSYVTWKDAKQPYIVPTYHYNYGPIYISTKEGHPWCEERFEDHTVSCFYPTYLAGANLWVLPRDYAVRTGQEPYDTTLDYEERRIQNKIAKRYRLEKCVFYARRFDQLGIFDTETANHVKQECSQALLSLQKQKMISEIIES